MKLIDAMAAAEKDPETPQPIRAGLCEARLTFGACSAPARWWFHGQYRCSKHKDTPR